MKTISSHAHKTGSWYLFGVLKFPTSNNNNKLYLHDHKFKQCRNSFYNEHPPVLFIWGVQLFVTCGCCRKLPQEVSNNLQRNNVGRQAARKCCLYLSLESVFFIFDKTQWALKLQLHLHILCCWHVPFCCPESSEIVNCGSQGYSWN